MTIFKWEIENIGMSSLLTGECMQSPVFHVEETRTFDFCLKLFPAGYDKYTKYRKMELLLWRCDNSSKSIEVQYKLTGSSTNFDTENISVAKTYNYKFQKPELFSSERILSIDKYKCGKILNVYCEIMWHDDTFKDMDRQNLEDLSRDCTTLLAQGTLSDVNLRIGTREFKLHRSILETRFPEFAKRLQTTENFEALGSGKDFQDLFLFLYSGKIGTSKKYRRLCMLLYTLGYPLLESMPNFCISSFSARTVIEVKELSFKWPIEKFVNIKVNEKFSYIIAEGRSWSWVKVTVIFKQINTDYPEFIVERLNNISNISMNFDISIKNAYTGFKEIILIHGHIIKKGISVYRKISGHLKTSDLQQQKYLRNGALNLSVHFELSNGENTTHITDTHLSNISSDNIHLYYLRRDFQNMLENPVHSDIVLKVNGTQFLAHKAILSARSPVFYNMFQLYIANEQNDEVVLEGIRAEVVHSMLSYIYCGHFDSFDPDLVIDLYRAASKYQIHRLKRKCSVVLQSALSVDNAAKILILADIHSDEKLKKCVFNFIYSHAKEVLQSREWIDTLKCRPDLPCEVLNAILEFVAENCDKISENGTENSLTI